MTTLHTKICAHALSAVCLAGCGTASTSNKGWHYSGPDTTLLMPDPRQYLPDHKKYAAAFDAWKQRSIEAVEREKLDCTRETGASSKPGFWTGYDIAFTACMRTHGWARSRESNPL